MRPARCQLVAILAAGLFLGAAPAIAQPRALDWTAFSVDARLDSTGRLIVRERQTILFTGDWNGGERQFDIRRGQRFAFRRLLRVDSLTGAELEMREGSLDVVDGYAMTDRETLRWRSRLPEDPLFLNTKITYVLEYEYADILVTEGTGYRLDHEFGFRDRTGTIANFDLTLRVDPAWRTPAGFTGIFHQPVLEPGIGFVVDIPLAWRGAGAPSAVRRSPALPLRLGLAFSVILAIVMLTTRFLRDETAAGRFVPLTPLSSIDRAWLETHVLSLRPELVGYAWDEQVGPAEVSATLARLVNEKKLGSRVESKGLPFLQRQVLHLELLVPRGDLQGYEKSLVDGFFAPNANTTSTDEIRARYKRSGFDPSRIIRRALTEQFTHMAGMAEATVKPRRWPLTAVLSGAAIALLALVFFTRLADGVAALAAVGIVGAPGFALARVQAAFWRRRVVRPWRHLLGVLVPMAVVTAAFCWALATGYGTVGFLALAGIALLLVAAHSSVLNGAHSTATNARLLRRKQLAAAREYCKVQLRQPVPALDDSWYPYLLAFGLGRHVDTWFRAFGGATTTTDFGSGDSTSSHASVGSGSGSGSSGGTFSGFGGGGGFSGAGATVAFGSAVGAMSSGVSGPSSSSSGGGSSSDGGSSGGGGGGGW